MATNETDAQAAAHGAEHGAGTEHAADHAAESSGGLPQLDFSTFDNQIFWLVVALVAIYFILSKIALPRVGGILGERQGSITNDIAAAEELKAKAEQAEADYNQALADARTEAQKIVDQTKADIQADLDAATAEADKKIAAKSAESEKAIGEIKAGALESVRIVAKEAAADIVAKMGGQASANDIGKAVDAQTKG